LFLIFELTLDVIVEHAIFWLILVQEVVSIIIRKVFKLNQSVLTEALDASLHEVVNKALVLLSTDTLSAQSNVKRIVEEFLNNEF
jgi:hypothetical protein